MSEMILHIPNEMFETGAHQNIDGNVSVSSISSKTDIFNLLSDINYKLEITNTGNAFLISGNAKCSASTLCSRCLESYDLELSGKIDVYYIIEGEKDFENEMLPSSHDIPLQKIICSALIVDAPIKPLCKQDCRGLCHKCGKNLNNESCSCKDEIESPFSVLKDFKIER